MARFRFIQRRRKKALSGVHRDVSKDIVRYICVLVPRCLAPQPYPTRRHEAEKYLRLVLGSKEFGNRLGLIPI